MPPFMTMPPPDRRSDLLPEELLGERRPRMPSGRTIPSSGTPLSDRSRSELWRSSRGVRTPGFTSPPYRSLGEEPCARWSSRVSFPWTAASPSRPRYARSPHRCTEGQRDGPARGRVARGGSRDPPRAPTDLRYMPRRHSRHDVRVSDGARAGFRNRPGLARRQGLGRPCAVVPVGRARTAAGRPARGDGNDLGK